MAAMNPSDPPRPAQPAPDPSLNVLFASMSGMGADEHGTHPPGATVESVQAGHEPDRFNARAILYVPLLIVCTVIVGFTIVTTLFATVVRKAEPNANTDVQAAAVGTLPINERFARISSTDPNAAVAQPRLEYFKQVESSPTDPAHYRSKRPIAVPGATYEIRPEDLRPQNFIDPTRHRKILIETGYVDKDKKIASIPIADAMELILKAHKLPVRKGDAVKDKDNLAYTTVNDGKAKLSNSGRGGPSMPVAVKTEVKPAAHEPAKH